MSATIRAAPGSALCQGPAEVTGDQMVAAMDAVGVDGAVLVSPFSMYRYDASYAVEVFARASDPVPAGQAGRSDRSRGRRDNRRLGGDQGHGGIRVFLRDTASTDPADPAINRVLAEAGAALAAGQLGVYAGVWSRRASWRRATPTRSW